MANLITIFRIIFSISMLFVPTLSPTFYVLYASAGITDVADGYIARKLGKESDLGAKLDSVADAVFFLIALIKLWQYLVFPTWMLCIVVFVAVFRIFCSILIYFKTKEFLLPHTLPNKLAGLLLFLMTFFITLIPITVPVLAVSSLVLASSVYELASCKRK